MKTVFENILRGPKYLSFSNIYVFGVYTKIGVQKIPNLEILMKLIFFQFFYLVFSENMHISDRKNRF